MTSRRVFLSSLALTASGLLVPEWLLYPPKGRSMVSVPGMPIVRVAVSVEEFTRALERMRRSVEVAMQAALVNAGSLQVLQATQMYAEHMYSPEMQP